MGMLGRQVPGNTWESAVGKQSTQREYWAGWKGAGRYLRIDIQHAHLASSDHTPDGVDTCPIEIALIFTMFQVAPSTDVSFHLCTGHKAVPLAFPL